jgi:hypothetical protein
MDKTIQAPSKRKPRKGRAMVIVRDVPPTYDWGWYSREDPRMHLQTVDKEHRDLGYKVWLERDGRRVAEPEPGMPAKVWRALQAFIVKRRGMIEAYWISQMMENRWLELQFANPVVTLIAYPRFHHRFVRTLDLRDHIGDPETLARVTASDVAFNKEYAMLEVFAKREIARRHHIRLESVLWK